MKKLSEFKWIRVTAMVLSVLQVASPVWSSDSIQMINNQPVAVVAADQEVPKLEADTQVSLVDAFEAGALSQPTPVPDSWIRTASNSDYFYGVEKNDRGTSRLVLYKKSGSGFQSEVLIDGLGDNAKDTLVDVSPDGSTVVYGYRRSKSVYFNGIPRFGHWEETIIVKSLRPASDPIRQIIFTETDGDASHYSESPIRSIQFEGETAKIVSSSGKIRYFDFKTFKEVSTFVPQGWTRSLTNSNFAYKITSTDQTNPMQENEILVVRDLSTGIETEVYNKPASQEDIWDKPDVSADGKQVVLTTRAVGGVFKVYVKDLTTASAAKEFVVSQDASVSKAPDAIQISEKEIRIEMVSADMTTVKGVYVIDRLTLEGRLDFAIPSGWTAMPGNSALVFKVENQMPLVMNLQTNVTRSMTVSDITSMNTATMLGYFSNVTGFPTYGISLTVAVIDHGGRLKPVVEVVYILKTATEYKYQAKGTLFFDINGTLENAHERAPYRALELADVTTMTRDQISKTIEGSHGFPAEGLSWVPGMMVINGAWRPIVKIRYILKTPVGDSLHTATVVFNRDGTVENIGWFDGASMPLSGWTRAASNKNFAFTEISERVGSNTQATLRLMDLRTGVIQNLSTYMAQHGGFTKPYDVAPDGKTVVYTKVSPIYPTPQTYQTVIQRIENPILKIEINERAEVINFDGDQLILKTTLEYQGGLKVARKQTVNLLSLIVSASQEYELIAAGVTTHINLTSKILAHGAISPQMMASVVIFDLSQGTKSMRLIRTMNLTSNSSVSFSGLDSYMTSTGRKVVSVGVVAASNQTFLIDAVSGEKLVLNDYNGGLGGAMQSVKYQENKAIYSLITQAGIKREATINLETFTIEKVSEYDKLSKLTRQVSYSYHANGQYYGVFDNRYAGGVLTTSYQSKYSSSGAIQTYAVYSYYSTGVMRAAVVTNYKTRISCSYAYNKAGRLISAVCR